MLGWLAEVEIRHGRFASARRRLDEACAFVAESGERYFEAELHRLRGDLALAEGGARDAVRVSYRRALAIARRQGAGRWKRRARLALAGR